MTDVMTKPHQIDCERPGRRHRGAAAERRQDRPYRTADDRQGHRQGVLRDPQLRRLPRHGDQSAAAAVGASQPTTRSSKPISSTSTMKSCGARRHSAPTRISTGAIVRRKPSCIAITGSRLTGAASDRGADATAVCRLQCAGHGSMRANECSVEPLERHCIAICENSFACTGTADRVAWFSHDQFWFQGENHMFAKYIAAGLAGSALLATVAFAQTPTTTTDRADVARRRRRRIRRSRATGAPRRSSASTSTTTTTRASARSTIC